MQNDDRLTPMEDELAAALAALKPSPAATSRDHIMFAAGQATARRRSRLWQGVSGVLVALLLASVISRPGPAGPESSNEQVAYEPPLVWAETSRTEPVNQKQAEAFRHYVRTRRAILDHGIEAIPIAPASHSGFDGTLSRADLDDLLS